MTGGTSGGKPELDCSSPELSSHLWKMEDVGLESPLSTLHSPLWRFFKVCSACLSIYPPLYMFVVCGRWSGQYFVFSHFPLLHVLGRL